MTPHESLIIWAVDPTQDPSDARRIVQELKTWAERLGCQVQPVSMLSRADIERSDGLAFTWKRNLEQMVREALARIVKVTHTERFLSPILLEVSAETHREMAFEMAKYAEERMAQLIFVNTLAKRTWNPFRLGGFAETLVAISSVPVLVMNPAAQPTTQISSILFPTNFSRSSRKALSLLKPWARAFGANVILYNQVEIPDVYPAGFDGLWPAHAYSIDPVRRETEQVRRRRATRWADVLTRDGVNTTVLIDWQRKYLGAEIIDAAKARAVDLIALSGWSRPLAQSLLGSAVRDVILQAECPVLVFHRPDQIEKLQHRIEVQHGKSSHLSP
ncbi:MAG: universal stress protein [Bdellovibrionaceae bacterium]|nr:universal stress protein [Pseudobdellovibrionaceae bacterium]